MKPGELWPIEKNSIFLNHGSFGSCPWPVLNFQSELRRELEKQPIQFLVREYEGRWDRARAGLASFLGAEHDNLVFISNATAGINTVLRSLRFEKGDELLVTNQEYNASRNALEFAAERDGAKVVVAEIPFPIASAAEDLTAVLESVTSRTRLALLDHVTSQTGLIMPLQQIIAELNARGIDSLVDGAHAPGMIPLDLKNLGATYYTGNCHKWICAPKGAAFLYVRPERQKEIRPLVISHGANSMRTDRSRFLIEFGWMGTGDPTAWFCVPEALRIMGAIYQGGWHELMRRNRELALEGREILRQALDVEAPAPDKMIGTLVSLPIPDDTREEQSKSPLYANHLQEKLWEEWRIEVPIVPWPAWPKRLIRISAQAYNERGDYMALGEALRSIFRK